MISQNDFMTFISEVSTLLNRATKAETAKAIYEELYKRGSLSGVTDEMLDFAKSRMVDECEKIDYKTIRSYLNMAKPHGSEENRYWTGDDCPYCEQGLIFLRYKQEKDHPFIGLQYGYAMRCPICRSSKIPLKYLDERLKPKNHMIERGGKHYENLKAVKEATDKNGNSPQTNGKAP